MQAIVTKYLAPTNTKGARIKAVADAGFRQYSWNHALDQKQNHIAAIKNLMEFLEWSGTFVLGSTPDNSGYAAVFVEYNGRIEKQETYPIEQ